MEADWITHTLGRHTDHQALLTRSWELGLRERYEVGLYANVNGVAYSRCCISAEDAGTSCLVEGEKSFIGLNQQLNGRATYRATLPQHRCTS